MGRKSKDGGPLLPFDNPLSRNDAPVTSFLAADRLVTSGKYLTQKEAVLEVVRLNPRATSAELAACVAVDCHLTASRLCEPATPGSGDSGGQAGVPPAEDAGGDMVARPG